MKRISLLVAGLMLMILAVTSCKSKKRSQENSVTTEQTAEKQALPTQEILEVNLVSEYRKNPDSEAFEILKSSIEGDVLTVTVQYGGGCEEHKFSVYSTGAYMKSMPPKLNLYMEHNGNEDPCRALIQKDIKFNLSSVQFVGSRELVLIIQNGEGHEVHYKY
jgi:flagellar basal body L-ring protein FlgH